MIMQVIVAGANGGIGRAIVDELVNRGHQVHTISRGHTGQPGNGSHLVTDLSKKSSVDEVKNWLSEEDVQFQGVICCSGILHDASKGPEKSLNQIDQQWLMKNIDLNVMPSVHLAQGIARCINRRQAIRWISLSAMVGSISDNALGGWYSYRMSKAALNMFIKNLSIEWSRKSPDTIVSAVHPGTTDTDLSKPFQAAISDGKLYSAELSADRICDIYENLSLEDNGKLLHWDHSLIAF